MAEMLLTWCKTTITYSLFIGSPVFEDDSPDRKSTRLGKNIEEIIDSALAWFIHHY
jgi:hypothetical protein